MTPLLRAGRQSGCAWRGILGQPSRGPATEETIDQCSSTIFMPGGGASRNAPKGGVYRSSDRAASIRPPFSLREREMHQPRHLHAALVVVVLERRGPPQTPFRGTFAHARPAGRLRRRSPARSRPGPAGRARCRRRCDRPRPVRRPKLWRRAKQDRNELGGSQRGWDEAGQVLGSGRPPVIDVRARIEQGESPLLVRYHDRGGIPERIEGRDPQRSGPAHRHLERIAPPLLGASTNALPSALSDSGIWCACSIRAARSTASTSAPRTRACEHAQSTARTSARFN